MCILNEKTLHYIILWIVFLNPFFLIAQDNQDLKKAEFNKNSVLTFNLLSPLNGLSSRWRVGYIKNIAPRWNLGLDIGFGNKKTTLIIFDDEIQNDYKLWEIRPELYYLLNPNQKKQNYVSLELFYINHKDILSNEKYFPKTGGSFRYDKANYYRQKYGFNIKYGLFLYSKRKLSLNFYTGLGLRIRNNRYSKVLNSQDIELPADWDMFGLSRYLTKEGFNFSANFSFGTKLYFKL